MLTSCSAALPCVSDSPPRSLRVVDDGRSRTGPKGVLDDYKDAQRQLRQVRMRQSIARERALNPHNVTRTADEMQQHRRAHKPTGRTQQVSNGAEYRAETRRGEDRQERVAVQGYGCAAQVLRLTSP